MKPLRLLVAWMAAGILVMIRATCKVATHNDPRPSLRARGQKYVYAILHAHQLAAALTHGEKLCGAMVSRSADGDLLIPLCKLNRLRPFRGSTRKRGQDKGGKEALQALIAFVSEGPHNPCTIAVDGPRGPRNHVHPGVAILAQSAGAFIVTALAVPRSRWILTGTWDRMQIPKPFTTIDLYFTSPVDPSKFSGIDEIRAAVGRNLAGLEVTHDHTEADRCGVEVPLAPSTLQQSQPAQKASSSATA